MSDSIQLSKITGFDYSTLDDPTQVQKLKAAATEIKNSITKSIFAIGKSLLSAKGVVEHGAFQEWVSAELGLSLRTAERYMAAADFLAKNDTMSVLKPTSLYLLASPSTSQSIRDKVATQIQDEQKVTVKTIRRLIDDARPSDIKKGFKNGQRRRVKQSTANSTNDTHEVRRKPLIRMTREVREIVRGPKAPANSKYFWARICRKDDYFVIICLSKTSPR